MTSFLNQDYVWALSGPVLLLYVAAVAIFLAVLVLNLKAADALARVLRERKGWALACVFLLTAASNFIGAATVGLLAQRAGAPPRLSMIAAPLLLIIERYFHLARRHPERRRARVWGLIGSAAGMLAGAWLLLRPAALAEPVARVVVPGDVVTAPLSSVVANPEHWAISVQLLVFYGVSLAIFLGAHRALKLAAARLTRDPGHGRVRAALVVLIAALALNFLGVAGLVMLAQANEVLPRQAMVGVPAFLVLESYVLLVRSDRANRRSHWAGLAGSLAGIAGGWWLLLRGGPLH